MNSDFGKKTPTDFEAENKKNVVSFSPESALEKILHAYRLYYDVKTENVPAGFVAEAEFHFYNQQYFLVKSIKLADMDSHDYVFFACPDDFSFEGAKKLAQTAWNSAMDKIQPVYGHKNSDVTVVLFADRIQKETGKLLKKIHFSISFKMGMYGWSNLRLAAVSLKDGKFYSNWHGRDLKKQIKKILKGN